MKLHKLLAIAATLALGAGPTNAQTPQNVPSSPQTLNVGSIIIGTGGNTLKLAPPTSGGASTFTFPASSLTFPTSNTTGYLYNDGTGALTWAAAGGLTLPYVNSASQSSGAIFQLTNTSSVSGTPIGITGVTSNGVGSYGQATGTGTGIQGDGLGTTSGYGVVGTGAGTAGVLAWATSSGSAVPLKILNSGGSLTDVSSTSWSISSAGVFSGNAAGLSLPYGPAAQDAGSGGLFTITNNGAAGYALGGQSTAGGIGVVAASSSTGAALFAQNTSTGIAISATAAGAGPVVKATATSTNDAIDAYGNVQILGTGGGGTGDHTNASLYVPYGDVTVGNHILTTDASGVGSLVLSGTSNISGTPTGGGTDVAGRATFSTASSGSFSGFLTVTYATAFAAGSYPVAVVTPVCVNGGVAVNITAESNSAFTVYFSGSAPSAESISLNYIVVGQNH